MEENQLDKLPLLVRYGAEATPGLFRYLRTSDPIHETMKCWTQGKAVEEVIQILLTLCEGTIVFEAIQFYQSHHRDVNAKDGEVQVH